MRFQSGQNPNRPVKGSKIRVDPIRKKSDIKKVRNVISKNPLHACLFTIGINTGYRISDLLQIRVSDVMDVCPGDDISIKEKKTGKVRRVTLNETCVNDIQTLLKSKEHKDDDYLFTSQRGTVLKVPYVSTMVKKWCQSVGLKGNFGSHTMRKTFGFQKRMAGFSLPLLVQVFGHSSQKQTLDYLGIMEEEIKDVFMGRL
jgi:integrase